MLSCHDLAHLLSVRVFRASATVIVDLTGLFLHLRLIFIVVHDGELFKGARLCWKLAIAREADCVLAYRAEKALRRAFDLETSEA